MTTAPAPAAPQTSDFWLGDTDVWLLAEGKHLRPWQKLGAHTTVMNGVPGTAFAVWAPHARQVGLQGDFNRWHTQPMRLRPECGVWELFVPDAAQGHWYKFEVVGADGRHVFKTDPYARETELPPGNAARICAPLLATPAPAGARRTNGHLRGARRFVAQARRPAHAAHLGRAGHAAGSLRQR